MDARSLTPAELASIGPHNPMEAAALLLASNPSQMAPVLARVLMKKYDYPQAMMLWDLVAEQMGDMR